MSTAENKLESLLGEEKKDEEFNHSFSISAVEDDGSDGNDEVKNKIVKFAEVEAEKEDAQLDQERSRQELLSKIARLTDILNEAQHQVQAEKDKRKKKEKSLLKLAKELKKRNLVREKEEDRLEELEEKKKYLEHHWVLAQKELDQEKALHAKLQDETQKEYDQVIKEEKKKFERAKQEHENRFTDLKKAHIEQCEELGREAMKARLEADRLHNELIARGMDIPRHAISDDKDSKTGMLGQSKLLILLSIFSIALAILGNLPTDVFTRSGLCAPVIPGTIFDDNAYGIFEAPWWAPEPMKEKAFDTLCKDINSTSKKATGIPVPSSIEWSRDGKNNKLIVSANGSVVLKRSVAKTQVAGNKITFWKRNNAVEEVPFNWISMK